MIIKLTVAEIQALTELVQNTRGRGGYQNLLAYLWYYLDDDTGEMDLPELLRERIHRYAFRYHNATWRKALRKVFRRTLGAHLNRGLRLEAHTEGAQAVAPRPAIPGNDHP